MQSIVDHVESALKNHHQLAFRSELHRNYSDLFVDHDQLAVLERPEWQVVFGRRGTGKTLLLGMQRERANERLADDRVLHIFTTAQDCLVSPVGKQMSDEVKAHAYFHELIRILVARISERVDELLGGRRSLLDQILGAERHKRDRLQDVMLQLLMEAEIGNPVPAFRSEQRTRKELHTEKRKAGAAGGVGLKTDGAPLSAKLEVNVQSERERLHELEAKVEEVPAARYSSVRARLIDLLDALHLRALVLQIDEWSVLDPTAATAIQPIVAELLKRTFSGTHRFSIKIATNRYQTKLNNRGASTARKGLELNADIFEATNLDHVFRDEAHLFEFYEELLYRRLRLVEPGLLAFERVRGDRPGAALVQNIFKDRRAFEVLVRGAEGVPRDFLAAFNEMSRARSHRVRPRWETAFVEGSLRKRSVLTRQSEFEYQSEADQLLTLCVRPIVEKLGTRQFLVRLSDMPILDSALEELLEKRLIHEVPVHLMLAHARASYRAFLLDYGLWLDWESTASRSSRADERALPSDVDQLAQCAIDASRVRPDEIVACPHCNARFSVDARPYVVRGLCASCYEPIRADA